NYIAGERPAPALLQYPLVEIVIPVRASSEGTIGKAKLVGIEPEHRKVPKLVSFPVKELVVVNFAMLAEDPLAPWVQIGLCRLAFNFVAQCVLPLVGIWQVELVEDKHGARQQRRQRDYRHDKPVKAHASGFHCRQLVG